MISVEKSGDSIVIRAPWMQADNCRALGGARWHSQDKVWTVPLTWASCVRLRGVFGSDLTIGPELATWARQHKTEIILPATALRTQLDVETWSGDDRLYSYQRAGVAFLRTARCAILGDEMGTGKTIQTLETLRQEGENAFPALVICPKSMQGTWAREAAIWAPNASVYIVTGTPTKRRQILEAARFDPMALVIIGFETLRLHSRTAGFGSIALKRCSWCDKFGTDSIKSCEVHPRELNVIPFRAVVADEAHRLKDPNAKQTRTAWALAHQKTVQFRFALSGTVQANNAGDLWSVAHFVAPESFPAKSRFVDRYCESSFNSFGGLEIGGIRADMRGEFDQFFNPLYRRTPKALVLSQLPPKVRQYRYVQMTPAQAKNYREMESKMITRLPDGTLMVAKANIAGQGRILQFSSATMESDGNGGFTMCDPSSKIDAMMEILEDTPGSIVFCAHHAQLIELAAARLRKEGIAFGKITGSVAQWERELDLKRFQDGELRVMLFTIDAGGVGLTMTAADTIVFLQRSWSMLKNLQAEDRVHRIGSERHRVINIIDVVTQDTIEEDQIERLREKFALMEDLNRDRDRLLEAGADTSYIDHMLNDLTASYLGEPSAEIDQ